MQLKTILPKVYRCQACSEAVRYCRAGFMSKTEYYCTQFEMFVDQYDGCTFGDAGDPGLGAIAYLIDSDDVYI